LSASTSDTFAWDVDDTALEECHRIFVVKRRTSEGQRYMALTIIKGECGHYYAVNSIDISVSCQLSCAESSNPKHIHFEIISTERTFALSTGTIYKQSGDGDGHHFS
jgi:hypothetical protein